MEQYAKMRKAELAAELEKMGIEQPNANMTKEKMLELIEQHSNRRRSPRLRNSSQSPKHLEDVRTRSKSPLSHIKSSPLRNRSKSPLKTESVAKQPIQQEKPTEQVTNGKKKRRNKKNKVIEKRVLLPPSASRVS